MSGFSIEAAEFNLLIQLGNIFLKEYCFYFMNHISEQYKYKQIILDMVNEFLF